MPAADWPFEDADEHDPLTALRIPVVSSSNPCWGYIGGYLKPVTEGPDYLKGPPFGSNERPTDAEAAMLVSFIEEAKSQLTGWYLAQMAERPLDVDNYNCGHLFIKYGPDDWGYRRLSWQYGPTFVPGPPGSDSRAVTGPLSLEQVMDRRHSIGDEPMAHWVKWKAGHPEVFPASLKES